MGLRVLTEEGGPIRFRHSAIRGIMTIVDVWGLFILPGVPGLLSIILSRKNQRLGDMLAGTIVLRERGATGQAVAVAFPVPYGYESYVASLDVGSITTEQYGIIRSFLMRVLQLTPGARASLALRLANPVAVQLHHTPPPNVSPELFLVCVAAAYQQRHGGPTPSWNQPSAYGGPAPGGPAYGAPAYGAPAYGAPAYGAPAYGQPSHPYPSPPPPPSPAPTYPPPPPSHGAPYATGLGAPAGLGLPAAAGDGAGRAAASDVAHPRDARHRAGRSRRIDPVLVAAGRVVTSPIRAPSSPRSAD
jgi:hypothetical protein